MHSIERDVERLDRQTMTCAISSCLDLSVKEFFLRWKSWLSCNRHRIIKALMVAPLLWHSSSRKSITKVKSISMIRTRFTKLYSFALFSSSSSMPLSCLSQRSKRRTSTTTHCSSKFDMRSQTNKFYLTLCKFECLATFRDLREFQHLGNIGSRLSKRISLEKE